MTGAAMSPFTTRELSLAVVLTTANVSVLAGWGLERLHLKKEISRLQFELEMTDSSKRIMEDAIDRKESRVVPIFPELRPYLEAAKAEAKRGAEFVLTIRSVERSRLTGKAANLGTRLPKIVRRAGLTPWPKQPASHTANGVGADVPRARCLRVDRQQPSGRPRALPASD